jgi:hypothetical protein
MSAPLLTLPSSPSSLIALVLSLRGITPYECRCDATITIRLDAESVLGGITMVESLDLCRLKQGETLRATIKMSNDVMVRS